MTKWEVKTIERLNQIVMRYRKCDSFRDLIDIKKELNGYLMFHPKNIIAKSELDNVVEDIDNWKGDK